MGEERCLFQDFMGGFPLWSRMSGASQVDFPHKLVQGLALNGHLGEGFPKAADWSDLEYCSLQRSLFPSRPLCPAHLSFHPTPLPLLAFPCLDGLAAFFPSAEAYFYFFFNQPQTPIPTSRTFLTASSSASWLQFTALSAHVFLLLPLALLPVLSLPHDKASGAIIMLWTQHLKIFSLQSGCLLSPPRARKWAP